MANFTRRAALTALAASAVAGIGYAVRGIVGSPVLRIRLTDGGMMGASPADMSLYMEMFNRHTEIIRTVEEIPGGVRTTTQSNAPDLAAQLHAHVSSMYSHVDQGREVMCMSQSLPTLFRNADGYRRQLTLTPTGVTVEETSDDPALTNAIRAHAREVSGFVRDGMPAMMQGMMGGSGRMMGPGGMMGPGRP
ncbi:hypothetical protein [Mycobacterium interjectum]|uniref:hypothetical protein n=1 Tax=Mycobacterium interjectum TaxID=33895 RepID=UPI000834F2AC|nr:hypothetical protein [Mycobacterium interjectum]MCV7092102.1 hypothetical protein [Mycobacterium interjectum]